MPKSKPLPELLTACRQDVKDLNALREPVEQERARLAARPKPMLHPMITRLKGKEREDPTLPEMVERIAAAERDRPMVAALGLIKLRERLDNLEWGGDGDWPNFVINELPFGPDRAEELMGPLVYRGGILRCSKCRIEARCSCGCGVAYYPEHRWAAKSPAVAKRPTALERATAALKAHPERPDRALAREIGVSHQTVKRARAALKISGRECYT